MHCTYIGQNAAKGWNNIVHLCRSHSTLTSYEVNDVNKKKTLQYFYSTTHIFCLKITCLDIMHGNPNIDKTFITVGPCKSWGFSIIYLFLKVDKSFTLSCSTVTHINAYESTSDRQCNKTPVCQLLSLLEKVKNCWSLVILCFKCLHVADHRKAGIKLAFKPQNERPCGGNEFLYNFFPLISP